MTMIHGRTPEEIKKFSWFKWSVLGGLGLLLIVLLLARPKPVIPGIVSPTEQLFAGETTVLEGTGKSGDMIELMVGGESVGVAKVNDEGSWSLPISIANPGNYEIVAHLLDDDGNSAVSSAPLKVDVAANVVELNPTPIKPTLAPDLANWDWDNGTPQFDGVGTPGETVELVDGAGQLVGTAVVAEDGNWAISWDQLDLAGPGSYDLTVNHKNEAGEVVNSESLAGWVVSDEAWVAGGGTVAVVDPVTPEAPVVHAPDLASWDWSDGRQPQFNGVGTPGETVELVDGAGQLIGTAVVAEDGSWAISWDQLDLAGPGSYDLTVNHKNEAGEVVSSESLAGWVVSDEAWVAGGGTVAIVDPVTPEAPVVNAPDLANWDWDSGTPQFDGVGTPGETVELVDGAGQLIGTAVVAEDGSWAISWDQLDLAGSGSYDLTVNHKNEAGEVVNSESLAGWVVSDEAWVAGGGTVAIVDPVTPEAPVVHAPDLANWDWDSGTPQFDGVGTPGETVELVDGAGQLIGTAVVAEDGSWAISWDQLDLAGSGSYDLTVNHKNEAGEVVSSESLAGWVVSDEAWAAVGGTVQGEVVVIIDTPINNQIKGNSIQLTGWSRPSSTVELFANGVSVGTVLAGKDGRWIFDYIPTNPTGMHEIIAYLVGGEAVVGSPALQVSFNPEEVVIGDGSTVGPSSPIGSVVGCTGEVGEDLGATYVVGPCEWMMQIARRLNISYWSLRLANPQVYNPNWIYPGQILNLPSDRYEQAETTP